MSNPQTDQVDSAADEQLSFKENIKILFGASRAYWMVNMVNFGDGIAYFGILHLITLFIQGEVGFTDQMTTISVSFFTGAVTGFMFIGGFVSDHFGVRKAISLSILGLLIGRVMLVLSPVPGGVPGDALLWVGLFIMAMSTGILQPALYAGVKEFTDPRTATIGYSLLYSIMNLGIVAEAGVSPLIREHTGISGVYWVLIGVTTLMFVLHILLFTRKIEIRDRYTEYSPETKESEGKPLLEKLKELPFLDAKFMYFIFILLPVRTLFAHQFLTIPHYIVRCFPEEVGARLEWFQGLNPLIIVIFVPLIAALTRKVSVIKMMIAGTTLTAITTFILVPGPDLTALILYVILFSFGEAIWSSRFLEWVADIAPAGRVGAYMGLAGIPWFLAKFTTGLYSGHLLSIFVPDGGVHNSSTMWLIYGIIACISPIGLIAGMKWMEKGVKNKPAPQATS